MPKPWEKYKQPAASKPWEKYKEEKPLPQTPEVESFLAGGLESGSFGFADEVAGAAKAGYQTLFGDKKFEDLPGTYRGERDKTRAYFEKAAADNPNAFLGGQVAGGVGTAFVPGLGVAKGASALKSAGNAAKIGAAMGLGTSTADLTKGDIEGAAGDTVLGAATGATTDLAFRGAGKALKNLTPTELAKKTSNVFLGAPEAATERYIKNPEAIKSAKPMSALADDFTKAVEGLKQDVISGSKASRESLRKEGATFTGREIADTFQKKLDSILTRSEGVLDPQDKAMVNYLESMRDNYADAGVLSSNRLKDAIQKMDLVTQWESNAGQFVPLDQAVKKEMRGGLDDLLKTSSPEYRKQMVDVASDTSLLNKMNEKTGNKDTLTNYLTSLARDRKPFALDDLRAFDKTRGTNFSEEIKDSLTRDAFDKSATNGSRNVNLYKTLGEAGEKSNIPLGKQAGAVVGATLDKYGPKIAMKSVDAAVAIEKMFNENKNILAVRQLATPVINAAKRGDPAAILTFQLLQKRNPELIELLNKKEGEE